MKITLLLAAILPAALVQAEDVDTTPFKRLNILEQRAPLGLEERASCSSRGLVSCYADCAPASAVCCSDGSGEYCDAGEYCVTNGCCPNGKTCKGGGGVITSYYYDYNTYTYTSYRAVSTSTRSSSFASTSIRSSSGGSVTGSFGSGGSVGGSSGGSGSSSSSSSSSTTASTPTITTGPVRAAGNAVTFDAGPAWLVGAALAAIAVL